MLLTGKKIVLGVCGSIASYKAADLASKLAQAGAAVDVVLTDAAQEFITPFTFRALTGRPVFTNMFTPATDLAEEHVEVARRADLIVIAPASASTLARIAHGLADDFLSLTVLATTAPLLIAPAMDAQMWEAAATQQNVSTLKERGAIFVGPDSGRLASGRIGAGRLVSTETILGAIAVVLGKEGDLAGKRIVVTAGGTQEPIDPVRYIGNHSSGKMGYALAEAARDRGAFVTLVSAVSVVDPPYGVEVVRAKTVSELRVAVLEACRTADALVMAAAVSDFRAGEVSAGKIKKQGGALTLNLVKNDDFLLELRDDFVKVGFAAETEDLIANARKKLVEKRLDLICANDVTEPDAGFGADTNRVTMINQAGMIEELPLMSKYDVANRILDRVHGLLTRK